MHNTCVLHRLHVSRTCRKEIVLLLGRTVLAMSENSNKEQPKNQPSYHNTNSSWMDVEDWINRATKAQNQEYLKNAGRTYNSAETIDQIETYILTTAFGNVSFMS